MEIKSQGDLARALVTCAEMIGHELSENAARAMAVELAGEPLEALAKSLHRCIRECRGRLTLPDVLSRLPGQHPSPNEAWALCPRDESATVVWTDEIAEAYGVAAPLLNEGDAIGARMAFLEAYRAKVAEASAEGRKPKWCASPGHDASQRASVLLDAVKLGRLPAAYVEQLLPPGHNLPPTPALPPGSASLKMLLGGRK